MTPFNINPRPPTPPASGPSQAEVASRRRAILISASAGAAVLAAVLLVLFPHLFGR